MKIVKIKNRVYLFVLFLFLSCNQKKELKGLTINKKDDDNYRTLIAKDLDKNGILDSIKITNSKNHSISEILLILNNKTKKKYFLPVNENFDDKGNYSLHFISENQEFLKKNQNENFDFGVNIFVCNSGCYGEYLFEYHQNNLILKSFKYIELESRLWSINHKNPLNIASKIERSIELDTILPEVFQTDFLNDVFEYK